MSKNSPNVDSDFYRVSPRNVYWETTLACGLACKHCRANAIPNRDPRELSTGEGKKLMDDIKNMNSMLVLTGGDPLKRDDIFGLLRYAQEISLPCAITPSATANLARETVGKFKKYGVTAMGISIDGPDAKSHDEFRGVSGTFNASMMALKWAREFGIPVQINSTVSAETLPRVEEIYSLLSETASPPVARWSLFLLVPTGRGAALGLPGKNEIESLFEWIYETSKTSPFHISAVEAPHWRRFWAQKKIEGGMEVEKLRGLARKMGFGIRDGNGVIFVSHTGEVTPAGFLPVSVGNVRENKLSEIYKKSEYLDKLRNMDNLLGKCGACGFRWLCGGSRSRAYAVTGNVMESDPTCAYEPS